LSPLFAELSFFGVSIKRKVEEIEKDADDTRRLFSYHQFILENVRSETHPDAVQIPDDHEAQVVLADFAAKTSPYLMLAGRDFEFDLGPKARPTAELKTSLLESWNVIDTMLAQPVTTPYPHTDETDKLVNLGAFTERFRPELAFVRSAQQGLAQSDQLDPTTLQSAASIGQNLALLLKAGGAAGHGDVPDAPWNSPMTERNST
jgi:hypothetical protein